MTCFALGLSGEYVALRVSDVSPTQVWHDHGVGTPTPPEPQRTPALRSVLRVPAPWIPYASGCGAFLISKGASSRFYGPSGLRLELRFITSVTERRPFRRFTHKSSSNTRPTASTTITYVLSRHVIQRLHDHIPIPLPNQHVQKRTHHRVLTSAQESHQPLLA